ncbi:metalloprotease TldD [Sandaracinobacteroides saxicola]|uniref:Metalloprotease TldD n=1 Tax=Sandaracinobacteroides saxicola TaxID=2759707 RepID=A0A7G5IJG6_9SPHN|nr:metalloprotease TldD [Sandaracinobacteroides saxicola]QMW23508.1 metalloprotease TldD [Sandaracinobacteroides saxicola]
MTNPDTLLYDSLDPDAALRLTRNALTGCDDGELFLQYAASESFSFDDGRLKAATFDTTRGFGLRGVVGETTAYAHANDISESAILRAADTLGVIKGGPTSASATPARTNQRLYTDADPLSAIPFARKVALLQAIDAAARARDPKVAQVSASLLGTWHVVEIIRPDGSRARDIRPLVRLNVAIVAQSGDRREQGFHGLGGRYLYDRLFDESVWQAAIDTALQQALVNLDSVDAPAGEMTVVLGPGWPGILLHEAVGHGLEGDFNRKGTSAFSGRVGQQVAAKGVTVVDDGTLHDRRGSLSIDDEGTPTSCTTLIEDGILKGYMQDRLNARLMGVPATGNGRRESFAHAPMPRMTNTFMRAGTDDPAEILSRVKNGIYAKSFGGGQVDITSGKFVFSCTEAYRVENGRLGAPLKGATLIGNGPDVMHRITAIGHDLMLDEGVGTCGKGGQSVPAGVGQPTLLIEGLTVGGTA